MSLCIPLWSFASCLPVSVEIDLELVELESRVY